MKTQRKARPSGALETSASDALLFSQLAAGDVGALGALYDRHFAAVQRFVTRATSGAEDVDDVAQNVFLIAAKLAPRYDGRTSARPWLLGIAGRLIQRRGRRLGQMARLLGQWAMVCRPSLEPQRQLEARNALDRVQAALARMSLAKRLVVLMSEVEGMTGP